MEKLNFIFSKNKIYFIHSITYHQIYSCETNLSVAKHINTHTHACTHKSKPYKKKNQFKIQL